MSIESNHLKEFLDDVGHSVHCMNTIAVALSTITEETTAPSTLNISWKPGNAKQSSMNSRRFAVKSAIVYSVESLFEYLSKVSNSELWLNEDMNFNVKKNPTDSKADRVVRFLEATPEVEPEWIILVELLCHWRNKVVHAKASNAKLSKASIQHLKENAQAIFDSYHHFDVNEALSNYGMGKFTLKDVSTLITMVIKSIRAVDKVYVEQASSLPANELIAYLSKDEQFIQFMKLADEHKKARKIKTWLEMHFAFLGESRIKEIIATL
ncbi:MULTISPECIES: hypothetical protein [Vibrio]|uniref:hypothetical protein n=1 Tax=Vibrio TaxID=662 RepID=UPI00063510F0|nr:MULTISPECIES: hypothetical protein [Vibrio]CAH6803119.1 Whole genome shotgun sequence [Vibrio chagasii]CAH6840464.1 Whole genome shotgun sequence [Vibrio chagasii]CAH6842369.1 Whole genome shotgun sequence [Vibrio chagasii]CAH7063537.1 Whole genome shotgun sequence [Vibrio chagasii]CAH7098097.1 Whole genome shotgun sequence [Vibrio chagasii]